MGAPPSPHSGRLVLNYQEVWYKGPVEMRTGVGGGGVVGMPRNVIARTFLFRCEEPLI